MEELSGVQAQLAWKHLEELFNSGIDKGKELKRTFLQQLRGNEPFRRTATMKDELMAHIRWSSRIIQGDMRVPVAVDWDSRHLVALLEFARVVSDYMHQHDIPLTLIHTTTTTSSSSSEGHVVPLLPPVSLALVLANLVIFFKPGGVLLRNVSLSPYCVVDRREYRRLLTAAFVHVDATHLITNLTAALPEVLALEDAEGSRALAADLLLLTLLSHGLYVGFAWLQKSYFIKRHHYYQVVTVGCSGVVFALKVWAGHRRGGYISVWGVPIPSEFAWVPSLAFTHLCVPEASFPAHLCGVLAGLIRAYLVQPVAAAAADVWHWCLRRGKGAAPPRALGTQQQQQQLGSSGRVLGSQPDRVLPAWRQERQQHWQQQQLQEDEGSLGSGQQQQQRDAGRKGGRWRGSSGLGRGRVWRNLSIHLGFAAAAAAVYLVTSSSKPNSKYTTRGRSSLLPWRH